MVGGGGGGGSLGRERHQKKNEMSYVGGTTMVCTPAMSIYDYTSVLQGDVCSLNGSFKICVESYLLILFTLSFEMGCPTVSIITFMSSRKVPNF
jgi:hypothetical protein